jgi:hypothetical protein
MHFEMLKKNRTKISRCTYNYSTHLGEKQRRVGSDVTDRSVGISAALFTSASMQNSFTIYWCSLFRVQ